MAGRREAAAPEQMVSEHSASQWGSATWSVFDRCCPGALHPFAELGALTRCREQQFGTEQEMISLLAEETPRLRPRVCASNPESGSSGPQP
jgi:hypothetical protein